MKIRNGFVSNSSSSSFIIEKKYISLVQHEEIKNQGGNANACDAWTIEDNYNGDHKYIHAHTWMDNFDLIQFCVDIGIPREKIIEC